MAFTCVICMTTQPPLEPLVIEHRQILEALISPNLHLKKQLKYTLLLACNNCMDMLKTVVIFRLKAIAGVEHLTSLLFSIQTTLNGGQLERPQGSLDSQGNTAHYQVYSHQPSPSQLPPVNVAVSYNAAPAAPAWGAGGAGGPGGVPPVLNGQHPQPAKVVVEVDIDTVCCRLCGKSFGNERALSNHARMQHIHAYASGDPTVWTQELFALPRLVPITPRPANKAGVTSVPNVFNETTEQNIRINQLNPNEEQDPLQLDVKNELDNKIQVKPYDEMDKPPVKQEELEITTELEIKMEPMAEETDSVRKIDDSLTVADTTTVNSRHDVQTSSTQATVEREYNVAVFTRRPAKVATSGHTGHPLLSGMLSAAGKMAAAFEAHLQQKIAASGHVLADAEQQKTEPDRVKIKRRRKKKPPGLYKCEPCVRRYDSEDRLKAHQERMHSTPEEPYICKICNKKSDTKIKYKYHMRMHEIQEERKAGLFPPDLFCAECEKQFYNRHNYQTHMLCVHTKRETWKYECDICGSKFPEKSRVYIHIQEKHVTKKRYRCKVCAYSSRRPHALRQHAATHLPRAARPPRPRAHVCHLCAKSFTIKKSLTEHLSMHAGLRPHACPLCPATFTYSAALYTHNRLKHLKIKRNWKKKAKKKTEDESDV